ncbi:MAG: IS701 family transposase [Isosphaera sp.]|nr:IS701 family transposase [Isosphaera sp.]
MSGRPTGRDVEQWAAEVEVVGARIGRRFARSEPRRRAVAHVRGLLSDTERKNGWQLAEYLGEGTPDGVQHLPARAAWDADAVRDDLAGYVHEHLGDPDGVLVVDETGFLKKGTKSCGVARQYTGTAGRIENAQVGVFLAYAGAKGHAFLDRALYLPKEWADDGERCDAAGVPDGVGFATKPQLAGRMIRRARRLGVRAAWVTGDTVYGHDGKFRRFLEEIGQPYLLAVPANQPLFDGAFRSTVGAIAGEFPATAWRRAAAGAGSKGPREYDWAVEAFGADDERGWRLWLVVRRHRERPDERAYFFARGPAATRPAELVRVAGLRWRVEECLELGKGGCGLDEYEVRSWVGWHRHVTLSLFALAVVAVIRSRAPARGGKRGRRVDPGERPGGAGAAPQACVGGRAAGRAGAGVVGVATPAPAPRPRMPLPETRGQAARLNNYGCRTRPGDLEVVVVLHGDATAAALDDEAYREVTGRPHPHADVMKKLRDAGVKILVCGQSLARKKFDPKRVRPEVKVAASAVSAVVNLQARGYAYVPAH